MTKKTVIAIIMMAVMAVIVFGSVGIALAGNLDDSGGQRLVDAFKSLATSKWGKALFFASLLVGIVCIVSNKYKAFGIFALVLGILLGIYGGLGDSLWNLFTGASGGSGGTTQ